MYRWIWPLEKIALFLVAVSIILVFVFSIHLANGSSMYPSISDGELCLFFRLETPQREDIVSYKYNQKLRMGRVVAIAGDKVSVDHGKLYVNGYEKESFYEVSGHVAEHVVSSQCVFIVNDYRADQNDSRKFGDMAIDAIEGVYFASVRTGGHSA
jgi:signal peptidase I